MSYQYSKLCSTVLSHGYYNKEGRTTDLAIVPAQACERVMRRHGLLFRSSTFGFHLYARAKGTDHGSQLLIPFDVGKKLTFYLISKTPYLINISALPMDMNGRKVLRFHNRGGNAIDSTRYLHEEAHVGSPELVALKPKKFQFTYSLKADPSGNTVTVTVTDSLGDQIESMTVKVIEQDGKKSVNIAVDLSAHPAGYFEMTVSGEEALVFYADDEMVNSGAIGIIELFADGGVGDAFRFVNRSGAEIANSEMIYAIDFKQREMRWCYNIVLKHSELKVEETLNIPGFSLGDSWVLDDEMRCKSYTVLPLTSDQNIAFHEVAPSGLTLTKRSESAGSTVTKTIIENLPGPNMRSPLKLDGDGNVYSEIFIYI